MSWPLRMTMMISVLSAPLTIYLIYKTLRAAIDLKWVTPEPVPGWRHLSRVWLIGLALFLCINLYPLGLFLSADMLRALPVAVQGGEPWAYRLLVYPYWVSVLIAGQITPVFLLCDLAMLPLWRLFRRRRTRWRRIESAGVVIALLLVTVYVCGRIYLDTYHVRVTVKDIEIHDLADDLDGFVIAHISDLQADPLTDQTRMQHYIDAINQAGPDIVLFSGDLVTSGPRYIDAGARMLGRIRAPYGVAACLGDHDIWAGGERVAAALRREGVTVLDNENLVVSVRESRLLVTGITSTYSRRFDVGRIDSLVAGHPAPDVALLLAHQHSQRMIETIKHYPYQLFLGGHTHGGQVVVGWLGLYITPVMSETPYLAGFYREDGLTLSINNGLGLTLAPVRFQAPAEVTLIRLKKKQAASTLSAGPRG